MVDLAEEGDAETSGTRLAEEIETAFAEVAVAAVAEVAAEVVVVMAVAAETDASGAEAETGALKRTEITTTTPVVGDLVPTIKEAAAQDSEVEVDDTTQLADDSFERKERWR